MRTRKKVTIYGDLGKGCGDDGILDFGAVISDSKIASSIELTLGVVPRMDALMEIRISETADAAIKIVRLMKDCKTHFEQAMYIVVKDLAVKNQVCECRYAVTARVNAFQFSDYERCTPCSFMVIVALLAREEEYVVKKLENILVGIVKLMRDGISLDGILTEFVVWYFGSGWAMFITELIEEKLRYEILEGGRYGSK